LNGRARCLFLNFRDAKEFAGKSVQGFRNSAALLTLALLGRESPWKGTKGPLMEVRVMVECPLPVASVCSSPIALP
jgi:hypothetical protein